jgi:hypothetical protein
MHVSLWSYVFFVPAISRRTSLSNFDLFEGDARKMPSDEVNTVIFLDLDGTILPWSLGMLWEWNDNDQIWLDCMKNTGGDLMPVSCTDDASEDININPYYEPGKSLLSIVARANRAGRRIGVVITSVWRENEERWDWLQEQFLQAATFIEGGIPLLGCTTDAKLPAYPACTKQSCIRNSDDATHEMLSVGKTVAERLVEIYDAFSSSGGVRPPECCGRNFKESCSKIYKLEPSVQWLVIDDMPLDTREFYNSQAKGGEFWPRVQREQMADWHLQTFVPLHFLRVASHKGLDFTDGWKAAKLLGIIPSATFDPEDIKHVCVSSREFEFTRRISSLTKPKCRNSRSHYWWQSTVRKALENQHCKSKRKFCH